MDTTTTLEREIKLRFESVDSARAAIEAAGATPLLGRRLQEDALLDDETESLRRRGCALRIRSENGKSRITFKGPIQASSMKLRDELETVVGDGALLLRVFEELGYHVWFRYEKYREEYSREEVIVAIDETPVGIFVEIEGSEQGITAMAEGLGRGPDEYVLDSYRGLFLQYRDAHGRTGSDMLFDE
jgi:adenylate cyclase class 2